MQAITSVPSGPYAVSHLRCRCSCSSRSSYWFLQNLSGSQIRKATDRAKLAGVVCNERNARKTSVSSLSSFV